MEEAPGSGDCELRLDWGQPALLVSSSAYVLAGLLVAWWVWHRSANRDFYVFAAGLVLTGLGSMDYHGPALGPEPQLHDGGLAIVLVAAAAIDLRVLGVPPRVRTIGFGAVAVAALIAVMLAPALTPVLAGLAATVLVLTEVLVHRRGLRRMSASLWAAVAALAVGVVVFALSRTGGPWCVPDSLLQGHAVWHLLTALALALWAVNATKAEELK